MTTVRDLYAASGRALLPAGLRQHLRDPRPRRRCARAGPAHHRRCRAWRRDGARDSAMSFWTGRTDTPGSRRHTGLTFRSPPQVMDLTLSYRALASGQVDLIAGDATAGLIKGLDFFQLEDNRHYFPPYDAAPVRARRRCYGIRESGALKSWRAHLRRGHARDELRRRREAREPRRIARRFLDGRHPSRRGLRATGYGLRASHADSRRAELQLGMCWPVA